MNEQKIFSGIGNYLSSEILYKAKILPHLKIGELDDDDIARLYKSIIYTIKRFYYGQGGKNKYYPDIKAPKDSEYRVYQKKIDKNGNKVIAEKINGSRTTYYVKFY